MTNRSQKSRQRTAICHFSFVIGHWSFGKSFSAVSAVVRKNVAPASSRQTVLLTQKELSRLTCRRDAGATILSHDQRLCGEGFGCGLAALSNLRALRGREKKCIAGFQPAKVVLTQKELSRLRCRRDAGATIFSHDPCLCGETGRLCGRRLRARQEIRCTFCCWPQARWQGASDEHTRCGM